ncbi:MAG: FAD-binding domain-containing protein [Maribacter sp.]
MASFQSGTPLFPTNYDDIIRRVEKIDPVKYGKSRNYIDGAITYLSPYISRGVISTKQVLESVLKRGYQPKQIEKFIQELAWRDYWQQIWIAKGNAINSDLKNQQVSISNHELPKAISKGRTGIEAIDEAIKEFHQTGYLHNHLRMYIAAIACNMGQSHWAHPAKWMYYHLLDGDWASNALSWQWVAGANSNKKYVANQENINKYCYTQQKGTFLDIAYHEFGAMDIPEVLLETALETFATPLPEKTKIEVDKTLPTLIYNFYNLDPNWKQDIEANRILLLEPSVFEVYPISQKSIDFIFDLSKNIAGIQVFVGEFNALVKTYSLNEICYKEHPLNINYEGVEEPRDWMFDVQGYFSSFFRFWKKCKKQLKY